MEVHKCVAKRGARNIMKIEQYVAGMEPPSKKMYKDRSAKIKKICLDYENRTIEDYLRGIAHNFQLQV